MATLRVGFGWHLDSTRKSPALVVSLVNVLQCHECLIGMCQATRLSSSREALTIPILAEIVGVEAEQLAYNAANTSFLKLDTKSLKIEVISDAYKQFIAGRLEAKRDQAEILLVDHYMKNPYDKSALLLLPTYLAKAGNYHQLKDLVTISYLARALDTGRDVSVLRQTLQAAATQAHKAQDWAGLSRYTLASSVLRTLSTESVGEDEVGVLMELGDHRQASAIAYDAILPEDRLELLARVYSRMQQEGLSVPDSVTSELEQIAATVDAAGLRERAVEIAATLFDLVPAAAIDLAERSGQGIFGEQSLDLARAMLAVRLEEAPEDLLKSKITDQALRDFARANSRRAARMTADEVISEAEKIKITSGKLHLLLSWCNRHRKSISSVPVVDARWRL